ncbi:MAG: NAD(P)-binding domain-containing protein [Clostridiales bacterium]|nr:NAD(P)-binding domain-containing protein [Clostridiales bacterium]
MKVTVIGAGNSGFAMAAHLSKFGNEVTLWNRSRNTIATVMETKMIHCTGIIHEVVPIYNITDDIKEALEDPDLILITTPAHSHRGLAELIAKNINKSTLIVLNPGRTFGALEFEYVYKMYNKVYDQTIAETQTIIYTCRKIGDDGVNIIALKDSVLLASSNTISSEEIINRLPACIREYFKPASSIVETSIGNVGMILHCAPMLLNVGWTESKFYNYKYYHDGLSPTVSEFVEEIDNERVAVSKALGYEVESTMDWFKRTYHVEGENLYECIQNNKAYETIYAPSFLGHRYIIEDIPCGLVPLEAMGLILGVDMTNTSLTIDLASRLMKRDFRKTGRNLEYLDTTFIKNWQMTITGGGVVNNEQYKY